MIGGKENDKLFARIRAKEAAIVGGNEMLAIGKNELKEPLGDTTKCRVCGQQHKVEYGYKVLKDGTREPSKLLAYYKCGDKTYLAGINGFSLP